MTPTSYKMNILFKSCMYTISSIILSYPYSKMILQKIPSSVLCCFSVSGKTGRPDRSTGACIRTCMLVHVCRPTAGSTDCKQFCSRVFWVDRPVVRLQKTVFYFRGRATGRSTRAQRLLASRADGRPYRSTARPAKCQRLFPLWCKSEICFYNLFWQTFSEFLEIFFRSNKLKINCF